LHVERDVDAGQVLRQRVEGDHAGMRVAVGDVPLNALLRMLFDDLGLEALADPPNLRLEGDRRVVDLLHVLDAMHELGPVLEGRPVVVGALDRDRDVDRLLNRHAPAAAVTRRGTPLLIRVVVVRVVVATAAEDPPQRVPAERVTRGARHGVGGGVLEL
jgi:hypothetical protein